MTKLPQIAPEVLLTASGAQCFSCGEPLHPPLGKPALCTYCADRTPADEREGFLIATRDHEQGVQAGKAAARKRRDG